ncbi:Glutamate carboxypeptidase Tre2, putative [Penicillium digitatum]|uniref:Glutamate carboxypeptidase Tre2, putative n=3 Tax=Penicillium digitatum TaxID=36651 RepID=K9FHA9_PEND2|nr:Glutamate carboxypeptidase Tre2, putative [Penicillium digitatum Pd1]EKV07325.1 Glutamate carboxypeptidase Tre2, putative [Penicillium digitatum Pd1]EKV08619.1 Glutamate carboxypeptidase Tre2, putative [Penicillium digitatum PHI26]QQK41173.1 Glutamate carboxypeptidase Tre2, putative [Penicillium digitatum]
MGDEKFDYQAVPIPSYAEATGQPSSSRSNLGDGTDVERQGLLGRDHASTRGYHPPTVESARSSLDDLESLTSHSDRESVEELRREIDQMDVDDSASAPLTGRQAPLRDRFSKQLSSLGRTLSAIQRPFQRYMPNLRFTINLSDTRARFKDKGCIMLLRVFALLLVVTLVYVFFIADVFNINSRMAMGQSYSAASVENFIQGHINETNIAENLRRVTNYTHMAGTEGSFALSKLIEQEFQNAGFDEVSREEFQVYLNYPRKDGRRVAIIDPPSLAWEAKLEEDNAKDLVFHGHSKSGNVTGHLVYANFGSREDFKLLADTGISLDGSIALVRYYGTESDRALKIKAAELAGAAGCIIYSDPSQDGFRKGPAFPDGRYMPSDGVQRGGVSMMSQIVGDVLSPGWASTPGEKHRLSPEDSPGLPKIPSLPLAWRDAQILLQGLKGHGSKVPNEWVGGVPDVQEWWTGDQGSPIVHLMNLQDEVERQPIYNIHGRITGMDERDKKIIVGNHRDSWCIGSVDPGSGTAAFLEVVRAFGELLTYGWRPLRTIEFVSWDGEEYNLIGSTEHVEKEVDDLRANAFAYLNVDVGVAGPNFRVSASPVFERTVLQVLSRISDPYANATLKDLWDKKGSKITPLGAGSDYVAFQDIAGTSSIDFGFEGEPYPYHSCYETYDWMVKFADPDFQYHKILAQFWGLLLLDLSESPMLPFDLEVYGNSIEGWVKDLDKFAKSKKAKVDMQPMFKAATEMKANAVTFQSWNKIWHDTVWGMGGYESNIMAVQRVTHNVRMAAFETNLLDLEEGGGIPNRTQFRHVIFGPELWSGYDASIFPAIRDSINTGNWTLTQYWIDRVAKTIHHASDKLLH